MLLTVLYAPEIDAFFDAIAAPDTFFEIGAFRNYLLDALVSAKVSWEFSQTRDLMQLTL